MKRKIFTLLMVMLCLVGITKAQSITLQAQWEKFGKWCLIPVDVYVDTAWENIYTAWITVRSSLEFVDFVLGTWAFPHVTPPVVSEDLVKFVTLINISEWAFNWQWKMWTVYYKWGDQDWIYEINLIADWIDKSKLNDNYWTDYLTESSWTAIEISDSVDSCVSEDNLSVEWGFGDQTYDEAIESLMIDLLADEQVLHDALLKAKIQKYAKISAIIIAVLLVWVVVLFSYKRKIKWKSF